MEASLFTCPICYVDFDLIGRTPRIIPNCGHTICFDCLAKIRNNPSIYARKCPFDKAPLPQSIHSCPKNFPLVYSIEQRAKLEKCEMHNHKSTNYLCLTEKKRICALCCKEHKKNKHDVESIEEIESQFTESIKQIHNFLQDVKTYHKDLTLKLQEHHQKQIEYIKNEFKKLRTIIDEKEEKMIFESKRCLAIKEFKLESIFGEKSRTFTKFKKRRVELENNLSQKNYFEEDFSEDIMTETQDYKLKIGLNKLMFEETGMNLEFNHLTKSIMNVTQDLRKSLNNLKTPSLLDNLDKIITAFSDEEVNEVNTSGQNAGLSAFRMKSNLAIEYSEEVLTIKNEEQNLRAILVDFEKWNSLHTVQFDLKEEISKEDLQLLNFILKNLGSSATFGITLRPKTLTDNAQEALLQAPINFKKLVIDVFCFKSLDLIKSSKFIRSISAKSKFLRELSLDMSCVDLPNQSLREIFKNADLMNLEGVSLYLAGSNIKDRDLLPVFVKMQNLKRFALDISETRVTDQTLEKCSQTVFASSPFLEEITLKAHETEITDLGVENFLSNMNNLKKLSLDLGQTHISDRTVHFLSQTLSKSPIIEYFEVWFSKTKIGDENFAELFKALPNVKSLGLDLGGTLVSDKTLETFIRDGLLSMKNIESLFLYLMETKVTDCQAIKLLENILNVEEKRSALLNKLNYLEINLWGTKVSEEVRNQIKTAVDNINQAQ